MCSGEGEPLKPHPAGLRGHSLLAGELLLVAEVEGLATLHHFSELLPKLPKLGLRQLLLGLLGRFRRSFRSFSLVLLQLVEMGRRARG